MPNNQHVEIQHVESRDCQLNIAFRITLDLRITGKYNINGNMDMLFENEIESRKTNDFFFQERLDCLKVFSMIGKKWNGTRLSEKVSITGVVFYSHK